MKTVLHGWLVRDGVDLTRDYLADGMTTIFIVDKKWVDDEGRKARYVKITIEDAKKGKRKC